MNPQRLIEVNPQKMGGTPVFRGTRVPIQNLFDCLEDGETIDQFLDQFPTVTKEQVNGILELSKERLLDRSHHSRPESAISAEYSRIEHRHRCTRGEAKQLREFKAAFAASTDCTEYNQSW